MNAQTTTKRLQGMTLLEVLVVIVVTGALALLLLPWPAPRHRKAYSRIACVNNLKQVGMAYRIWENDNGDKYPMDQLEALGGMQEILSNSVNAGRYAYLPYAIMQNDLGQSSKIVVCPSDDRMPAANFYWGVGNAPTSTNFSNSINGSFDNTNVSYFCGVGALDTYPQSI